VLKRFQRWSHARVPLIFATDVPPLAAASSRTPAQRHCDYANDDSGADCAVKHRPELSAGAAHAFNDAAAGVAHALRVPVFDAEALALPLHRFLGGTDTDGVSDGSDDDGSVALKVLNRAYAATLLTLLQGMGDVVYDRWGRQRVLFNATAIAERVPRE
jgi:hypothetical protein